MRYICPQSFSTRLETIRIVHYQKGSKLLKEEGWKYYSVSVSVRYGSAHWSYCNFRVFYCSTHNYFFNDCLFYGSKHAKIVNLIVFWMRKILICPIPEIAITFFLKMSFFTIGFESKNQSILAESFLLWSIQSNLT